MKFLHQNISFYIDTILSYLVCIKYLKHRPYVIHKQNLKRWRKWKPCDECDECQWKEQLLGATNYLHSFISLHIFGMINVVSAFQIQVNSVPWEVDTNHINIYTSLEDKFKLKRAQYLCNINYNHFRNIYNRITWHFASPNDLVVWIKRKFEYLYPM